MRPLFSLLLLVLSTAAFADEQAQRFGIADMLGGTSVADEIRPGETSPVGDDALNTPARLARPVDEPVVIPTVSTTPSQAPVGDINWRALREQALSTAAPASPAVLPDSAGEEPVDGRDRLLASLKRKKGEGAAGKAQVSLAASSSLALPSVPPDDGLYRHDSNFGRTSAAPAKSGHSQDYAAP